jgi:hypothetical protein
LEEIISRDARLVREDPDFLDERSSPRRAIWYDSAPTPFSCVCFHDALYTFVEIAMYIGGGILGTILLILLIVWLVRRV